MRHELSPVRDCGLKAKSVVTHCGSCAGTQTGAPGEIKSTESSVRPKNHPSTHSFIRLLVLGLWPKLLELEGKVEL